MGLRAVIVGVVLVSSALVGAAACVQKGAEAPPAVVEPVPVTLLLEPNAPPPDDPPPPPPAATAPPAKEPEDKLPPAWTAVIAPGIKPTIGYAEAIRGAKKAQQDYAALKSPQLARGDGGVALADEASAKEWFTKSAILVERADRFLAAAFVATDAKPDEKADAIAAAASLASGHAARLDALGLAVLPRSWQADERVHATFEDVDVGPSRRLRSSARALAGRCVLFTSENKVKAQTVTTCANLSRVDAITSALAARADAGAVAKSGCPCALGDPLCSGNAWCGP
jgi:hypothetical protein